MKISLIRDLEIRDAGTERTVVSILNKLQINSNDIVLDFCECGVDYPATSRIIDKVLFDLSERTGKKTFTIVFDFKINEVALHKWFFVGSSFFGISETDKELTKEKFKDILNSILGKNSILLSIEILSGEKTEKILQYGSN
jgi:hypothetical protein